MFNNRLSGGTVNLYNGANVQFGNVRQTDGSTTYGKYSVSATTNDANGGYMNFANSSEQSQNFGNLTLGSDLKVGTDFNLAGGDGDNFIAGTVSANSHSILIDYINAYNPSASEAVGTTYTDTITANSTL